MALPKKKLKFLLYWIITTFIVSVFTFVILALSIHVITQISWYENEDRPIIKTINLPEMTQVLSTRNESKEAIFYIESTGSGFIKSRYVCGLESAGKYHPDSDIYLLMINSPRNLDIILNKPLWKVINMYKNIQILYVDMDILFNNSKLESFYHSNKLNTSSYKSVHTSDVVRILTLWKYGGKYIDLDTILVKNISHLKNFVIFMYPQHVGSMLANGILGLEKNSSVASFIINRFDIYWNGGKWETNGPLLLTLAMEDHCHVRSKEMTSEACNGFIVFEHKIFFPIPYYDLNLFFDETKSNETMSKIHENKDLLGIHISNSLVSNKTVKVGSQQPYAILAMEFCPISYWSSGTEF